MIRTIYKDTQREVLVDDDEIVFARTGRPSVRLPWCNVIDIQDAVTDNQTLEDLRKQGSKINQYCALNVDLSGGRRVAKLARQLAIPVPIRSALEAAIDDHQSRKTEIEARKAEEQRQCKELETNTISVYLSSRGWGDYSPVEWSGDGRRPDVEILAECRHLLATGHDVDDPRQSDEQILTAIHNARARKADEPRRKKEAEEYYDRDMGAGYCYSCQTWCYGDCGNYQPKRTGAIVVREAREASDESNYGIND